MPAQKNETTLPDWLKQQQHQSWQIEILIASGLILFLFNLPPHLINYLIDIQESTIPRAEEVILFLGAYIFSRALLIGFIVTLFLRSLWLAFLGINYAFPEGINERQLSFSDYFMNKIKNMKSVVHHILTLEKICSLTFSVTIMVTLLTAGLFFFLTILFYLIYYLVPSIYTQQVGLVLLILILFIVIGLADWLFFGVFKRYPIISKIYYPVYKLFQWLSLSFLYHHAYLTFISNVRRWKVYGLFLIYFLIAFFISTSELQGTILNIKKLALFSIDKRELINLSSLQVISKQQYENMLTPQDRIISAAIPSDVIKDNYLKVFIVYFKTFDESLDSLLRKNNYQKTLKSRSIAHFQSNDSLLIKSLNEFFRLKIDNQELKPDSWFLHKHFLTGEQGFLTYLPLDSLKNGTHFLSIHYNYLTKGRFKTRLRTIIPFYFNQPAQQSGD